MDIGHPTSLPPSSPLHNHYNAEEELKALRAQINPHFILNPFPHGEEKQYGTGQDWIHCDDRAPDKKVKTEIISFLK